MLTLIVYKWNPALVGHNSPAGHPRGDTADRLSQLPQYLSWIYEPELELMFLKELYRYL